MTLQQGQIEVQGVSLRCWEGGHGESVVILDGPSWDVGPLAEALAKDYRVARIDLSGLGQLAGELLPKSGGGMARLLGEAIAFIGVERYTLIATSLSATAAMWHAQLEPEQVEALALLSPIGIRPTGDPSQAAPEELVAHPERGGPIPPAVSEEWQRLMQSIPAGVHEAELEGRMGEIGCATLAVFGLEDRLVSPEAARVYRERIPNCNISLVYDAGHALLCDRPEAVTGAVADFVERRETFIVGRESGVINP